MMNRSEKQGKAWRNRFRAFKRRKLDPIWIDLQWPLIGIIFVAAVALGYIGFEQHYRAIGEKSTELDLLYRSIQLITFESGDIEALVPWQLEAARFLVPAVAAYAAIQALISIFQEHWHLMRIRFLKRHVVVCGLGDRGMQLVAEFLDNGYQVIAIESEEDNPNIDQVRKQGALALIADATDIINLRRARVQRAKFLVAVCSDDGTNAEIAVIARNLVHSSKKKGFLTAFVHIVDLELCNLLHDWEETAAEPDLFSLEFFNVLEQGARLMLVEQHPFKNNAISGKRRARIVIVGLGKLGRSLVVQAAQLWVRENHAEEIRFRAVIIDRDADKKLKLLLLQNPEVEKACDFEVWQLEKNSPDFEKGDYLFDLNGHLDVDIIYICFDDDVHALVNAITLYKKTKNGAVPIVVRMNRNAGLAVMMKEEHAALGFGQIHAFSLLERTCTLKALFENRSCPER